MYCKLIFTYNICIPCLLMACLWISSIKNDVFAQNNFNNHLQNSSFEKIEVEKSAIDSLAKLLFSADNLRKIEIHRQLAEAYLQIDTKLSLQEAKIALRIAESIRNKAEIASSHLYIGIALREMDYPDEALQHFFIGLHIAETENLYALQADFQHQISEVYLQMANTVRALQYAETEKKLRTSLQQKNGMAKALTMLGSIYIQLGKYDKAYISLSDASKIAIQQADTTTQYDINRHFAELYIQLEDFNKAIFYAENAKNVATQTGNHFSLVEIFFVFAKIHQLQSDTTAAIRYNLLALEKAKTIGSAGQEKLAYKNLAHLYESTNNFRSALYYYKIFAELEDSIYLASLDKNITILENKYEAAQKDREISLLTQATKFSEKQFVLTVVLILLLLILLLLSYSKYKNNKQNNAQLLKVNAQMQRQNIEISRQKQILEQHNAKINQSVAYAQKLQEYLYSAQATNFMNIFNDFFIYNQPLDQISGDFYLFNYRTDTAIFVVADCAGHGVTGAFNTVIVNSLLVQIISESGFRSPADILKELHQRMVRLQNQEDDYSFNEGIEIAIFTINVHTKKMIYAGARIPLYMIKKGELQFVESEKIPVGGRFYGKDRQYTNRLFSLDKNDKIFLFTDGYTNQFGGENNTKFFSKNLRKVLSENANLPLSAQENILIQSFLDWKKNTTQTDDVLIIGVEI